MVLLPHSYIVVPAVALNQPKAEVVERTTGEESCGSLKEAIAEERVWLKNVVEKLQHTLDDYKALTWASHHAHLQPSMMITPSINAMLPLFTHKADSPAMDILQRVYHLSSSWTGTSHGM